MSTYGMRIEQVREGSLDLNEGVSTGAEFAVTWGSTDSGKQAELPDISLKKQGVAMPTAQPSDDAPDDEEINQMKLDRVHLQARTVISDERYVEAATKDPEFAKIAAQLASPQGKAKAEKASRWRLENGVLWKRGDVDLKYVPLGLRREVIDLYHGSDFNMHAGRDSTLQDLKSRFYWPEGFIPFTGSNSRDREVHCAAHKIRIAIFLLPSAQPARGMQDL